MLFKRLLILQLDSVPWSVLRPLLDDGSLPHLKRLYAEGCSGTLRSTVPPITPAAWATFMSGVSPGKHGILNFKGFDPKVNAYRLSSCGHLANRNIYRLFSDGGMRVGVVMQPSLHPPFPVNGFLLTGFDAPGTQNFAFPSELESEVLKVCPEHAKNLNLHKGWQKEDPGGSDAVLGANLGAAAAQMQRVTRLALDLIRAHPVDVLTVYFQAPDVVFHKAWRECLPDASAAPARRRLAVEFFQAMDRACGDLLAAFPAEERLTLVLSDHGHQAARHSVFVNTLLKDLGFLAFAGWRALARDGWRRMTDFARGIRRKGLGRPIDWTKTVAFMPYQACSGMVYINVKGRQPFGCVEPWDYTAVRDRVMAGLRECRLPGGEPVFEAVLSGDEFFHDKSAMQMPDIVLLQGPGVDLKRRARAGLAIGPLRKGKAGIHHPDGLYILHGPGVVARRDLNAQILDMAPTLLAALGQPVPSFMEGRVVCEWFTSAPTVMKREWAWETPKASAHAYSAAEEKQVEERLADLGYLD